MSRFLKSIFALAILSNIGNFNVCDAVEIDHKNLTFELFTELVQTRNPKIQSLNSRIKSHEFETSKAEMLTTSKAFSEVSHNLDKSPVLTPEFTGSVRQYNEMKVGVEKQWESGIKNRFFGLREEQRLEGVTGLPQPNLAFTRSAVGMDAEVSLMKNGFGRSVRHERDRLDAISKSETKNSEAQSLEALIKAQSSYIEIVQVESSLNVQRDLVNQGEKLVTWVKTQVRDRLLEPVHLAEANGALEYRRLGLVSKELQWKNGLLTLGQWIQSSEMVNTKQPQLDTLESLENKIKRPRQVSQRRDLEGKSFLLSSERNRLQLEHEQFRPDLNLKAKYLSYQKTEDVTDSLRCNGLTQCHHYNLSLQFSIPLDFSLVSKGKAGIKQRVESMELSLQNEQQVAAAELENLQAESDNLERQISVLKTLVKNREIRLHQERQRQRRARASTFDLIRAEQDLSESVDRLLDARARRLQVFTQLKYFEAAP